MISKDFSVSKMLVFWTVDIVNIFHSYFSFPRQNKMEITSSKTATFFGN